MLCRRDIAELWDLRASRYAVQVVQHDYLTRHRRKYANTPLECSNEDDPRKNWSSLVLWNCEAHKALTRDVVQEADSAWLSRFEWLPDHRIGALPPEWNHLVGEYDPADAALAHYTLGVPGFSDYRQCEHAQEWAGTFLRAVHLAGESPSRLMLWAEDANG